MPAAALAPAYLLTAFALRALVLWRRTGDPGWAGLGRRRRPHELTADLLYAGGWLLVVAAPALRPRVRARRLGAVLVGVATAGTVWAQEAMGEAWRTGIVPRHGDALVTAGPFALVRHPFYTCSVAAALGCVLAGPTAVGAAGVVLQVASIELYARRVEEPFLLERHGAGYARYAACVGRFLPGLGRWRVARWPSDVAAA